MHFFIVALFLLMVNLFGIALSSSEQKQKNNLTEQLWSALDQDTGSPIDITNKENNISCLDVALQRALDKDDFSLLTLFLNYKSSLECENELGFTPLMEAVRYDNLKVAELLLKHGAKVNACRGPSAERFYEKTAPIHIAAERSNTAMIQLLYTYSANLEKRCDSVNQEYSDGSYKEYKLADFSGKTPLHFVARSWCESTKSLNCAELLVNLGARVDDSDEFGQTPLHLAALYGNEQLVQFFIEKKVSIQKKDANGESPLFKAVRGGYPNIINLLLTHRAKKNDCNNKGRTLLHIAASERYWHNTAISIVTMINFLVKKGIPINEVDKKGRTALYLACKHNNFDAVQALLTHNALIYHGKKIPLNAAVKMNNSEITKLLLMHGAQSTAQDKKGNSPLHHAKKKKIMKILLKNVASVDVKNYEGKTPLHYIVYDRNYNNYRLESDRIACAKLLLAHGADINAKDNEGQRPLDYALHNCNCYSDCIEFLLTSSANIEYKHLLSAYESGDKDKIMILIKYGANINAEKLSTPL
jgi:ankyrin repeat protein